MASPASARLWLPGHPRRHTANNRAPYSHHPRARPETTDAIVKGTLDNAFGYQGDAMDLPVADLESALSFYQTVLGFRVSSRNDDAPKSAVLSRDAVEIGLAENGRDPSQDGCAFHVKNLQALFAEFQANGLAKELSEFSVERHDDASWKVFYVVAPDGLCYWFGERQPSESG